MGEQGAAHQQRQARQRIGRSDHDAAAERVEETAEQERAEKIAEREWQDVPADLVGTHCIEFRQHQRVGEEDGVVEEGLRGHQGKADEGPLPMCT